ncbi:hypothetical protein Tco_1122441 [Tanacetum coccineum]|uniref:Uncharacterized protein n=1 Tax=Tanacetum coccineum TaxID=301880 RepID=A0ABQ5J0I8_9ASTR
MVGSQYNKFRGDKVKVIMVLVIRVMLLVLVETMQVDRQGLLNATTVKVKDIWLGNALSLSDQGMQHDPGVLDGQAQTIIPHNAAFQTEDLDTYDSDCDDLSTAQAVLMVNISIYGFDIISEVPNSKIYLNDMDNQSVQALRDFEQTPVMDFTDNEISSDSNIIPYSQYLQETQQATVQDTNSQAQQDSMILSLIEQMSEQMINHVNNWEKVNKEQNNESITTDLERYKEMVKKFEQRLNIDLSCREKMIDSQMDDMIREKLALKEQIDSLEQNLSKQIKEKESLFKTFLVFKNESKEKENKYLENEIDLEKKIKELDNIICKVGQSAQTVHIQFDSVVKKRVTPNALEEVSMQLKKEVFQNNESYVNHNGVEIQEYFEIKDLKARLQEKDTTIWKLKDTIKSLSKNTKEENVNHDKCELEPINEELENSVAKLLSENERLYNEINNVKQVFKDQFDSIKQTRVRHKEQSDSLINKLNLKSVENEDLKAQIQDKVFVITSLKNDLRKSKGKEIVENVIHTPSATTISPGMFKLDLEPLPPSAKKVTVKPMNNVKKVRSEVFY